MSEQLFQAVVVWTLLVTTIAQSVVHYLAWKALGPQPKDDLIAFRLRQREGALAAKGVARAGFEFLLLVLVVNGRLPFTVITRDVIYVVTTVLAIYAIWRGAQFISALHGENWGRPRMNSSRQIEQSARDIEKQAKDIGDTIRSDREGGV